VEYVKLTDELREKLAGQVPVKVLKTNNYIPLPLVEECGVDIPDELIFSKYKTLCPEYEKLNDSEKKELLSELEEIGMSKERLEEIVGTEIDNMLYRIETKRRWPIGYDKQEEWTDILVVDTEKIGKVKLGDEMLHTPTEIHLFKKFEPSRHGFYKGHLPYYATKFKGLQDCNGPGGWGSVWYVEGKKFYAWTDVRATPEILME